MGLHESVHYSDINWVDLDAHQILPLLKKTVLRMRWLSRLGNRLTEVSELLRHRKRLEREMLLKAHDYDLADDIVEYASVITKARWPGGEKFLLGTRSLGGPECLCEYVRNVVKGRWEEYERAIIDDPHDCYEYARCIIKGRLPEHMHTAMVMHSFSQPDNKWVKKYLGAKKYE